MVVRNNSAGYGYAASPDDPVNGRLAYTLYAPNPMEGSYCFFQLRHG